VTVSSSTTILLHGVSVKLYQAEGKRQLGRPRRRWDANIRMEIRKIRWEGVNWINLGSSGGVL
jgi:hypothetical protein